MHNKLINTLRILLISAIIILGVLVLFRPAKTETNILKAVFSSQDSIIVDLSSKFSAKINVIVESDSPETAEKAARTFYTKLNTKKIHTTNTNISQILESYETYSNNLLSDKTEKLLKQKKYDIVESNAMDMLYNPIMPPIGSIEDDPFLLLTDYIMSPAQNKEISNFTPINGPDNKYYSLIMLNADSEVALSPTVLNTEVKKLVDLQKEISKKDNVKIYLSGAPVHSYFASSHSIFEINLICILSTIFVIAIVCLYFKSVLPLIPIALSIGLGVFAGYCMTALIFKSIHILTFVFSTTLIGICVDYSLHYFVSRENNETREDTIKEIFKSLTVSLLTTISAFLILLFANFILLRQISVFTITGLTTVYLIVILFYPMLPYKMGIRDKQPQFLQNLIHPNLSFITPKTKKIAAIIFAIILVTGICRTKFDDNIKNMYVPPKFLMAAEKLQAELMGTNAQTSIIVVRGNGNIQNLLEKEEKIQEKLINANIDYQSLSKYVPSAKHQIKNKNLIHQLYIAKLNDYAQFLPVSQRNKLINNKNNKILEPDKNFDALKKNFLLDKNTSIIVVNNYNDSLKLGDGASVINFQKDITSQIRKCRYMCLGLLLPIMIFLYLLLSKIYNCKSAFIILSPSIMAVCFVFGMLGIFHVPINFFHILAIFLIIGFGLDYSVFRYNGARKCEDAVLLSCLTSVFSFALLSLTGFKLISSLGTVLALGLLSSYIFSLVLIKGISKDNCQRG